MSIVFKLDASFFVDCRDLDSVPNLSDYEIADRIESLKCKIERTAKDRRLRSDTRQNRIAAFERMREALITEQCRRSRSIKKLQIRIPKNQRPSASINLMHLQ